MSPFLNLDYIFRSLFDFILGANGGYVWNAVSPVYYFLKAIFTVLSAFFFFIIIYVLYKLRQIKKHEAEHEAEHEHHRAASHTQMINPRWQRILNLIHSENATDWRLAILESDIVLDEMLSKMGYHGETVSDKLKSIEKSDFTSLDQAWEAHKIRNAIAHEGTDFLISEREARRVLALYSTVFKEFHFI